jgi:hypothetical protein
MSVAVLLHRSAAQQQGWLLQGRVRLGSRGGELAACKAKDVLGMILIKATQLALCKACALAPH